MAILCIHLRIWANNGHTPIELFSKFTVPNVLPFKPPVDTEKIGRNSPCPCGSGKKYKRCCGK
ncbi:MAG: SEC-C metal-binding domain-containing protein [Oscillospiraceae bacterium]